VTTKEWTGNKKSVYTPLGASNHVEHDRPIGDFYVTHPSTITPLFEVEDFDQTIWECACGTGELSKAMEEFGKDVFSTDKYDRGYGQKIDFLEEDLVGGGWEGDIITNPPYSLAKEFIERGMSCLKEGKKMGMFLKLQFLEGQRRKKLFEKYPPKVVYVFSKRQICALNGNFKNITSSAIAYCWFVWVKGYKGDTIIKWL
jgi:hypothetical protein